MHFDGTTPANTYVALRTEGVDRNHLAGVSGKNIIVALRIEGLGRNLILIV